VAQRGILVDGATCAALEGRIAAGPLGEVQLKGKSAKVEVFAIGPEAQP